MSIIYGYTTQTHALLLWFVSFLFPRSDWRKQLGLNGCLGSTTTNARTLTLQERKWNYYKKKIYIHFVLFSLLCIIYVWSTDSREKKIVNTYCTYIYIWIVWRCYRHLEIIQLLGKCSGFSFTGIFGVYNNDYRLRVLEKISF